MIAFRGIKNLIVGIFCAEDPRIIVVVTRPLLSKRRFVAQPVAIPTPTIILQVAARRAAEQLGVVQLLVSERLP
jgi:hypothetical protein